MLITQPIERNALIAANKTSTICNGRVRTWTETHDRIACLAAGLQSQGLQQGDRVAILSLNSDFYYETFFAAPWAGGALVPLNIRWSVPENIYALEDSDSRFLIVDDKFLGAALEILERTEQEITLIYAGEKEAPEGMLTFEDLIRDNEPVAAFEHGHEDMFGIFYTGGTTGFPKGVMLSHRGFWSSSMIMVPELGLGEIGLEDEQHTYLHSAPMFHCADAAVSMCSTIATAQHVFIPAFTPKGALKAIEEHRVTVSLMVPTMISMMIVEPELETTDLSSLEKIAYGASPITEAHLREAMHKMPKVGFLQAYGQSEMAPVISVLRPEHHILEGEASQRLRSAGRPAYGIDVRIVDEDNNNVPQGQVGQIVCRGDNNMMGYWNKPEQTASALVDGWIYTGDAGYLDHEGYLFLVDRVKDMIVTGGENVFSVEVENAVARHDAVHEVVVIGIPNDKWGEQVHAIVRLSPGKAVEPEELIAHCHEWIAGYKCPRSIEFREEPFPITGAGKIRKKDLREEYWYDHDRHVG